MNDELDRVRATEYDFIDVGCKNGGSYRYCEATLAQGPGLGIDTNADHVAGFRDSVGDALVADATETGLPDGFVRFACLSHVLEHLDDWASVEQAMVEALRLARDFVLVIGPYFDADDYLESLGLKFYWSDWTWHPTHVYAEDLARFLRSRGIEGFESWGKIPIPDSTSPTIHPLASPMNQHDYDPDLHPPKQDVAFEQPVYREMVFIIPKRPIAEIDAMLKSLKVSERLPF